MIRQIKKGLFIGWLILSSGIYARAQKIIPVSMEGMAGHNGLIAQTVISKKFKGTPKLGVFNLTTLVSDWGSSHLEDFMHQSVLTYEIVRGLDIVAGAYYTPNTNFRATSGLMYTFANKNWFVMLYPRIDLLNDPNLVSLGIVEYYPKINDKINFYSRVQGLYIFQLSSGIHQSSTYSARAGIGYREFTFGLGANVSYYGPVKRNVNNVGLFLAFDLY